jgi:IclR family acetate operon transcriptional repressor
MDPQSAFELSSQRLSSVERALKLLELISSASVPPTQTDLLRSCPMPKSTLSLLLARLERSGYVTPVGRGYLPGPAAFGLGYRVTVRFAGSGTMEPVLRRLVDETGESAAFGVEVGGHAFWVEQCASPNPVHFVASTGEPRPLHCTALGRVLLAFTGRSAYDLPSASLVRLTPHTQVDPEQIDIELARTRQRGYALNLNEGVDGVSAIAAPVWTATQSLLGGVSVIGPSSRMSDIEKRVWPVLRAVLASRAARSLIR